MAYAFNDDKSKYEILDQEWTKVEDADLSSAFDLDLYKKIYKGQTFYQGHIVTKKVIQPGSSHYLIGGDGDIDSVVINDTSSSSKSEIQAKYDMQTKWRFPVVYFVAGENTGSLATIEISTSVFSSDISGSEGNWTINVKIVPTLRAVSESIPKNASIEFMFPYVRPHIS